MLNEQIFLYERHFGSFFSSYMYAVKAAKTKFVQKICTFNVDEIDTWFFSKACSSFRSWLGLNAVRILFGLRNGNKNSGRWGPEKTNKLERFNNNLQLSLIITNSMRPSMFARYNRNIVKIMMVCMW